MLSEAKHLGVAVALAMIMATPVRARPAGPNGVASAPITVTLTTSAGQVVVALHPERAPVAVASFVTLARAHFYDGQSFYRVLPGLAVESGDPTGKGTGGPGFCVAAEPSAAAAHAEAGVISLLETSPGMTGSRFVITLAPAPVFDGHAVALGEVTAGLAVLQKLAEGAALTRVEVGDAQATLPIVKQVKDYREAELGELARARAQPVLAGLGSSLGLGKVDGVRVDSVQSRCGEGQVALSVDFHKGRSAHLLVYGTPEGGGFVVRQLQFSRGALE